MVQPLTSSPLTPWQLLAQPFPFEDIEIKVQKESKESNRALACPYITSRAGQRRLDEAFGPENWSFEIRPVEFAGNAGFIGRLTIHIEGREVVRESTCELSNYEPLKGADSGAFKRCFSALGFRCLYHVDLGWHDCIYKTTGKKDFDDWTDTAWNKMRASYEKQVGLSGCPSSEPAAPAQGHSDRPQPSNHKPQTLNLQSIPVMLPKGANAFGHVPKAWPTAGTFTKPNEPNQKIVAAQLVLKRGIPKDDFEPVRTRILTAYGLDLDAIVEGQLTIGASKGAACLFVDWLQNAGDEAIQLAIAATRGEN